MCGTAEPVEGVQSMKNEYPRALFAPVRLVFVLRGDVLRNGNGAHRYEVFFAISQLRVSLLDG